MLSNHERKALRQIQRDLSTHDPGFARSFGKAERLPPPPRDPERRVYMIWIVVVTSALSLLSLAVGAPVSAALFAVAALAAVGRLILDAEDEPKA